MTNFRINTFSNVQTEHTSGFKDVLWKIFGIIVLLLILPLLLLAIIFLALIRPLLGFFQKLPKPAAANVVFDAHGLFIKSTLVDTSDLPLHFRNYEVCTLNARPQLPIFEGTYFTDLLIVKPDGFVFQAIEFDEAAEKITSLPVCYFDALSGQVTLIKDLNQANVADVTELIDHYLIIAYGNGEKIEIIIDK